MPKGHFPKITETGIAIAIEFNLTTAACFCYSHGVNILQKIALSG
jgi:hypothetical protein